MAGISDSLWKPDSPRVINQDTDIDLIWGGRFKDRRVIGGVYIAGLSVSLSCIRGRAMPRSLRSSECNLSTPC